MRYFLQILCLCRSANGPCPLPLLSILLLGFLFIPQAKANTTAALLAENQLYQTQVTLPLAPELSKQEWLNQGFALGLAKVLPQVTLEKNLNTLPWWQEALNAAPQLVSAYQIKNLDNPDEFTTNQSLNIHFQPEGVNKLLQNYGLMPWTALRPKILFLIAENNLDQEKTLYTENSHGPLFLPLKDEAESLKLSVNFLLGDLQDISNIDALDIWQDFNERLIKVAQRYEVNTLILVKIHAVANGYFVEWRLMESGWSRKLIAPSAEEALKIVFNESLVRLRGQWQYEQQRAKSMRLLGLGIQNFAQLQILTQDLKTHLPIHAEIRIDKIYAQQVELYFDVMQEKQKLLEALKQMPQYQWFPDSDQAFDLKLQRLP